MLDNGRLLPEQMRKERNTAQAVYLKFINNRKDYGTHIFCFYEEETGRYYDSRIRRKLGNAIYVFAVRSRKEVLELLDRISLLDEDVCTLFFVNRCYGISKNHEKLFVTPCYSIENLYVQRECFVNILRLEFGLGEEDYDFKKCLQDFSSREEEFNDQILELNSLAYLGEKLTSNYKILFDSIETTSIVKVEVNKISKTDQYDKILNDIKEKLQVKDEEIEKAKNELSSKGNYTQNFRGKNELDFFVEFVKDLKRLNNVGGYFSQKYSNVHIHLKPDYLNGLSKYSITPPILEEFLEKHRKKGMYKEE